jgi:DNA-directed RNA polymerase subunit N
MMFPIRCFTCGSLIGDKYEEFKKRVEMGEDPGKVLDSLGVKRYCCRRMFITNVDIIDQILPYEESVYRKGKEYQVVR